MSILIKNGTVIDPACGVCERRDIWIDEGRISSPGQQADQVIYAEGKVVCPGFIDIHMHEDPVDSQGRLESYDEKSVFACMLHMGVTTAVAGNCGENKYDPADYLDIVDRDGAPVNVAMLAGHSWFRRKAGCGDKYSPATLSQQERMAADMEEALGRGCIGISYGIRYEPGMDMRELIRTAEGCRKSGKLVAAHIRDDADFVFDAAREYLDAGAELGVPLQLSHIGSMAGFGQMRDFLSLVDEYRDRGVKVGCDCYPYDAFSTGIGSATYDEGWRERYGCDYDAVELCEGEYKGVRCTEELFNKVRREHPSGITVCHVMRQDEVDMAYQHPGVMVASDSTLNRGQGHPRACGCFPRVLSRYVRAGVLSMEEAIARMTVMPARQLGLKNKGSLQVGMDADVVIFDPETIQDMATFGSPLTPPSGVDRVIVNGVPALRDGQIIRRRSGRAVRK